MIDLVVGAIKIAERYQVVIERFEIGVPEPKLVKVSIPGRNGDLDMSDALTGYLNYGDREITVQIGITGDEARCEEKKNQVLERTVGKRVRVSFTHLDGYFIGRCTLKSITREIAHYTMTLSFICEPYRYDKSSTIIKVTLTDQYQEIVCKNSLMPVTPEIEVGETAMIIYGTTTQTFVKGKHTLNTTFFEGNTTIKAKGKGELKIMYRKGVI